MLEITTDKNKNRKKLLLDGYTYMVRRPGAGESLDLTQFGKQVERWEKRDDLTPEEEKEFTDTSMRSLGTILSFFDSLGSEEAQAHLKSIDPEELMGVIDKVFKDTSVS